jgi:ubiquinone/menaquinone biosynthesis C-methylase UbiE
MARWIRRLLGLDRPTQPATSTREIARFFDEASRDEEHFPSSIDPRIYHVQLVLKHMRAGRRIADIGCGKGRFARLVREADPARQVIALDLSAAMLGYVPGGILPVAASMTALPLASGCCDGAYATESLEHAIDISAAIDELCRIVRPGGRILIIDKNAEQWGRFKTPEWEKWFDRKEVERLLRRHCRQVESRFISYWEDVEPDGLFVAWLAEK